MSLLNADVDRQILQQAISATVGGREEITEEKLKNWLQALQLIRNYKPGQSTENYVLDMVDFLRGDVNPITGETIRSIDPATGEIQEVPASNQDEFKLRMHLNVLRNRPNKIGKAMESEFARQNLLDLARPSPMKAAPRGILKNYSDELIYEQDRQVL